MLEKSGFGLLFDEWTRGERRWIERAVVGDHGQVLVGEETVRAMVVGGDRSKGPVVIRGDDEGLANFAVRRRVVTRTFEMGGQAKHQTADVIDRNEENPEGDDLGRRTRREFSINDVLN